jgi:hypothetical protein
MLCPVRTGYVRSSLVRLGYVSLGLISGYFRLGLVWSVFHFLSGKYNLFQVMSSYVS